MTEKLMPCPFCGGEAVLQHGGCGDFKKADGMAFVRCADCGSIGQKIKIAYNYCADDEAVKAWNRRTLNCEWANQCAYNVR